MHDKGLLQWIMVARKRFYCPAYAIGCGIRAELGGIPWLVLVVLILLCTEGYASKGQLQLPRGLTPLMLNAVSHLILAAPMVQQVGEC